MAINRDNNPDTLLVLWLVLAAWVVQRAVDARRRGLAWLVVSAVFVGCAFNTKMLQAYLVVPALALVYLVAARTGLVRRVGHLLVAAVTLAVSSLWWLAIVDLMPAEDRPYVGGSTDNTVWDLVVGYNGLGRVFGGDGGPGGGRGFGGAPGTARMFNEVLAGQISWLLPWAVLSLLAGLVLLRRRPRADAARAGLVLWGGWLAVHWVVFSFMRGIFHEYYTVALAPAVAALVGLGAGLLWRCRDGLVVLAAAVAATALWSYLLLERVPGWHPWLRWAVLGGGIAATVLVGLARAVAARWASAGAVLAVVVALAGPVAYTADTIATPHTGAIPVAGPSVAPGGPGARGGLVGPRMRDGLRPPPGGPVGGPGGPVGMPSGRGAGGPGGRGGGRGVGGGGLLDAAAPGVQITALLKAGGGSYTWVAAAVGSNAAAGYQLATGLPVMAVGGFNGTDPAPGLERFQQYVRQGRIHYFLGSGGAVSGSDQAQRIAAWVAANFTARTVDGVSVYDLTVAG